MRWRSGWITYDPVKVSLNISNQLIHVMDVQEKYNEQLFNMSF